LASPKSLTEPGDVPSIASAPPSSLLRNKRPDWIEYPLPVPVMHRQSFTVSQYLHFQDILELRRHVVRVQNRWEADHLLGPEKKSRGLPFVRAGTEKIRKN
jgi:hypothetical protein